MRERPDIQAFKLCSACGSSDSQFFAFLLHQSQRLPAILRISPHTYHAQLGVSPGITPSGLGVQVITPRLARRTPSTKQG